MTTQAQVRHVSATELASLIRQGLKQRFPKTKFSVRSQSFSMGSSVDVRWTDGPTAKYVEEFTSKFKGRSFNGMDDSTHYHDITLPSGERASAGSWISTSREISDALVTRVIAALAEQYHVPEVEIPTAEEFKMGRLWNRTPMSGGTGRTNGGADHWSWQSLIHQAANDRTAVTQ